MKSGLPRHQRYVVKQQGSVVIFYWKSSSQSLKEHTIEAPFETVGLLPSLCMRHGTRIVQASDAEGRWGQVYFCHAVCTHSNTKTQKAPKLHHWQGTYLLERIQIQDGCLIHQTIRTIATWADVPLRGGRVEGGKQLSEYPERIEIQVFPACFITCLDRYHPLISLSHGTHKDTSACANSWCLLSHSYHFSRQSAPTNQKIPSRRGPCLQLKRSRYCRKQEMEKPTIHNLLTQIFTRAWQWMKAVQETPNPIQIARRAWKEASRVR